MRNGSLADLARLLEDQSVRKYDLVVPSRAIHAFVRPAVGSLDGETHEPKFGLFIDGADFGGVSETGELETAGLIVWPNDVCDEGISERLGIPIRYYRRMCEVEPELLATNVQTWLDREPDELHLLRTFRTDGDEAIGRALLSSRYQCLDHYDMLMGVLDGVREACPGAVVDGADLSDRRMRFRVTSPEIAINISELVGRYNPRGGGLIDHSGPGGSAGPRSGEEYPLLFAGFVAENSETGNGAWTLTPRAVVQVCTNGLTRSVDAIRKVHLGGRLEEGPIVWSTATRQAQVELIRNQARDSVATFLSVDYLERFREEMANAAGVEVTRPVHAVEHIRRTLSFTPEQGESILAHFLGSGDESALGLAQAITHEAKSTMDDDLAADMEAGAINAALMAAAAYR